MDLVPYLTGDQARGLIDLVGLAAGAVAFLVGLSQYKKAQTWKRHEFVAQAVREFDGNPLVRNAMQMIDWGTREIELFPSNPNYDGRFELITRPILHAALITHDRVGRRYTRTEVAIRDCFDAFFGGLERFEQFIEAGLVTSSDFEPYLRYWVRSICEEANPTLRHLLDDYVRFYRFDRVSPLFEAYHAQFGTGAVSGQELGKRVEIQEQYESLVSGTENAREDANQRLS